MSSIGYWGAGMVICLERDADLHMAQLMPLPLTVSCFSDDRLVLPFWYRLTWAVAEKGPLNGCVCVRVRVFGDSYVQTVKFGEVETTQEVQIADRSSRTQRRVAKTSA